MAKADTDKEKPEEIWNPMTWYATRGQIDEPDFEDTRRCLLNSYHSYVQTHGGYIIALLIGLFAVIATFHDFLVNGFWGSFAFIFLILAILVATTLMAVRVIYWTFYTNIVLTIPIGEAIRLFNDYNKLNTTRSYKEKAPNTAIIQLAIFQSALEAIENNGFSRFQKGAMWVTHIAGQTAKSPNVMLRVSFRSLFSVSFHKDKS